MNQQMRLIEFAWLPLPQAAAYFGLPETLLANLVLLRDPSPVRARVADWLTDDWGLEVWHEDVGIWLMTRREELNGSGLSRQRLMSTATRGLQPTMRGAKP